MLVSEYVVTPVNKEFSSKKPGIPHGWMIDGRHYEGQTSRDTF
jgi:hypothetical protein